MDKLEQIMKMQGDLQKRLGTNFSEMTLEERAAFMRNHRGYLADEVAEALYEMPNYKLWKDYSNMSDEAVSIAWQKVRMELIDSLHFFVNLLLCAGMTADEVYEIYMAKNRENHRRQDDGYTADKSYRDQSVEDVMSSDRCSVSLSGTSEESSDFIAFIRNVNDGSISMSYTTDLSVLLTARDMLAEVIEIELQRAPEHIRARVQEAMANE